MTSDKHKTMHIIDWLIKDKIYINHLCKQVISNYFGVHINAFDIIDIIGIIDTAIGVIQQYGNRTRFAFNRQVVH